jgi:protein ImuA
VWRGDALGSTAHPVIASGHGVLDAELPGHGWPCRNLTDVLCAQGTQAEWRLLSPALARVIDLGGSVMLIGAPCTPHLPGLAREGLRDERLVRIVAPSLSERLWATEQALKARCFTAVLSWLPHARPEQIRRLQACASRHPGLAFVLRPAEARHESSAAPLRVMLDVGPCPHPLRIEIVKRRGPVLEKTLQLAHWPEGLAPLLPMPQPDIGPLRPAHVPEALPIQGLPSSSEPALGSLTSLVSEALSSPL